MASTHPTGVANRVRATFELAHKRWDLPAPISPPKSSTGRFSAIDSELISTLMPHPDPVEKMMCANAAALDVLKNYVVTKMFVDPADQNYVMARLAYRNGMYLDFFWNGCQAVEKYLKAALLLNGESTIKRNRHNKYGHDLVRLFRKVETFASGFFPENLVRPAELGDIHWREETPAAYVERLNAAGEPSNRYNLYGYSKRWEDLCHLDQFVFLARRVAFKLDYVSVPSRLRGNPDVPQTIAEALRRDPKYSPRRVASRLDKLIGPKSSDELRHAALQFNFPFAPDDYDHGKFSIGSSASNPVLYHLILSRLGRSSPSAGDADAAELADWVVNNIFLPPDVIQQLKVARDRLRE